MAIEQLQMQAYAKQWGQLVARAWGDDAFKQRLLAEPAAALAEQGIAFPPGMEVRVHEETATLVHLALPPATPADPSDEPPGQASMAPFGQRYVQLAARAWDDEVFKQRLLAEPAAVLAEEGIAFPPGVEVRVHESTPVLVHLSLPPKPSEELSDEQLDAVAGGDCVGCASTAGCFSCPVMSVFCLSTTGSAS